MAKGVTTEISATSRVAIKIKDNYYTIEATEKRAIPESVDLDEEWSSLWSSVNKTVDNQAAEIYETFAKR